MWILLSWVLWLIKMFPIMLKKTEKFLNLFKGRCWYLNSYSSINRLNLHLLWKIVSWLKAPGQLLNGPNCKIVWSSTVSRGFFMEILINHFQTIGNNAGCCIKIIKLTLQVPFIQSRKYKWFPVLPNGLSWYCKKEFECTIITKETPWTAKEINYDSFWFYKR